MVSCPNCSAPVEREPVECAQCGYRSSMATEYFWLYLGGSVFVLAGFVLGALGVIAEGASPGHWSELYRGWFPLAPWPAGHGWLAFIVLGIAWTILGLGVTRRRRDALAALLVLLPYLLVLAGLTAAGALEPAVSARPQALLVLAIEAPLALLLLRLVLAYRRTPPRRLPQDRPAAVTSAGEVS
jgi:hypothetical protein